VTTSGKKSSAVAEIYFNALFLSRLISDTITANTRLFALNFCRRQYLSIFNQFDIIELAHKATEFSKITRNDGHYALQHYSLVTTFSTNRKTVYATKLHLIWHRFQDIGHLFNAIVHSG